MIVVRCANTYVNLELYCGWSVFSSLEEGSLAISLRCFPAVDGNDEFDEFDLVDPDQLLGCQNQFELQCLAELMERKLDLFLYKHIKFADLREP